MLTWSRILIGPAALAGIWAVTDTNAIATFAFLILMAFSFVLRAEHFEQAHARASRDAGLAQQNYNTEQQLRHRAELRAYMAESLQSATESTLVRVTALWSRTIRPTTAERYANRIMNLKGETAALASAVMLARAATDDLHVYRSRPVEFVGFAEGGPISTVRDGASDAVPPITTPDPSPWSLVPVWVWRTVAGAVVFVVGVVVWWVVWS